MNGSDGKLTVERGNNFYQLYPPNIYFFEIKNFYRCTKGSRVLKKLTRKTRVFFLFFRYENKHAPSIVYLLGEGEIDFSSIL